MTGWVNERQVSENRQEKRGETREKGKGVLFTVKKIKVLRQLLRQAKDEASKSGRTFFAQEARTTGGDFLFIGSGRRPGLKSVPVVRKDGTLMRMEFDPAAIQAIPGGSNKIFKVDLECAEHLVK